MKNSVSSGDEHIFRKRDPGSLGLTRNPKPKNGNLEPETRNPKPHTQNATHQVMSRFFEKEIPAASSKIAAHLAFLAETALAEKQEAL